MSDPLELFFSEVQGAYNALWHIGEQIALNPAMGNRDDWLLHYKNGLRGMLARILAVDRHFVLLHEYQKEAEAAGYPGNPNDWALECEYHAGLIFFGMDSSLECFVFTMNALGFLKDPGKFYNITTDKGLRGIGPANILGGKKGEPQPGYAAYFPGVKDHWEKHRELFTRITDYHDVSKHRSAVSTGGGVGVLHIRKDPRQPGAGMSSVVHTVQSISRDYQRFIDALLPFALEDIGSAFGFTVTRKELAPPSSL